MLSLIRFVAFGLALWGLFAPARAWAFTNVFLIGVPDYDWWHGCFGTATGNLMGYWDRHGLPDFYVGPTAGGVAPLDSREANAGIRSLWATRAGFDGRPANQFGHDEDYWVEYEDTGPDPYVKAGRPEHPPDCLGDFIGLNQNKWTNLNNECAGNIDGFAFVFWEASGARRTNYVPPPQGGRPVADIPSGLKAWTEYRQEAGEVSSQLADFNPTVASGRGFSFADLKAEINAGYPVLLCMQDYFEKSRAVNTMTNANPNFHGMVAYGYYEGNNGAQYVRYRDSWAGGNNRLSPWTAEAWVVNLPVRGVITYHPLPKIKSFSLTAGQLTLAWHGPASELFDAVSKTTTPLHWYVVENSPALAPQSFRQAAPATTNHSITITNSWERSMFFRVRLVNPGS